MFIHSLILAAGSLATLIQAIPHGAKSHHSLHRRATNAYAVMGGTGDSSDGWPSHDQWGDYKRLWLDNKKIIDESCDNSEEETQDIKTAIDEVSETTGVDARFILAVIMQESNGCVRVHSTNNGVQNTGLMQSHAGKGSCNQNGAKTTPCPFHTIKLMINDGVAGTDDGDGLKQCFESQTGALAAKYYKAARAYNSGSIDPSGNLGAGGATHCYASDIANRVRGWAGSITDCLEDTIGGITSGLESAIGDNDDGSSSSSTTTAAAQPTEDAQPIETSSPAPAPVETTQPTEAPQPSEAPQPAETPSVAATPTPTWTTKSMPAPTTAPAVPSSSSAPIYPEAASPCQKYYAVMDGDFCDRLTETVGISLSDLRSLNGGLDHKCSNLWLGYQYCIKA